MNLPFSIQQFFQVFRDYNTLVWPLQIFLYALALLATALIGKRNANRILSAIIAFLWAWMGIVYHIGFFSQINHAAYLFGILFLIQSLLTFWVGVRNENLRYSNGSWVSTVVGGVLIFYALLVYPLLSNRFGHLYPYNPTFGAPCPTTIFTVGIFVFLNPPFPRRVLIIPALWCVIGTSAAFWLRVPEDFGLVFAGLIILLKMLAPNASTDVSGLPIYRE